MRLTAEQLNIMIRQEILDEAIQTGVINEEQLDEKLIDWIQGGLNVVGLIPGVGEAADGVNALISVARGNPLEALLSLVSMVPVVGDAVGKSGMLALEILDPAIDIIKNAGPVADVVAKIGPDAVKKLGPIISTFKDVIVKNKGSIDRVFKVATDIAGAGDPSAVVEHLGVLDDIIPVKIPDALKLRVAEVIKDKMGSIDADGIKNTIDFIRDWKEQEEQEGQEGQEGKVPDTVAEGTGSLDEQAAYDSLTELADSIGSYTPGTNNAEAELVTERWRHLAGILE